MSDLDADNFAYKRVLSARDPEILAAIDGMDAAVLTPRSLDSRTIELLMIVILTTLRGSQERLRFHMRRAIAAGASEEEILQALECIIAPSGLPIFEHGLSAWADVVGAVELHPKAAPFSP